MKSWVIPVALMVLLLAGGLAAALAQGESTCLTGCLTPGGTLVKVAVGPSPAGPCSAEQTEVTWGVSDPIDDRQSYWTHLCNVILEDEDQVPTVVMSLDLPAGVWLAQVSIQAGPLGPCGGGHPLQGEQRDGNYHCWLEGGTTFLGGHPASSRSGEFRTLAWSAPVILEEAATVTVVCEALFGDGAALSVGDFVATPSQPWLFQEP